MKTDTLNTLSRYAVERAVEIAAAYNALIRAEIGATGFELLRKADPAISNEHDMCDANQLMLCAIALVLDITEDGALKNIIQPHPEVSDLIAESAEGKRERFSLNMYN